MSRNQQPTIRAVKVADGTDKNGKPKTRTRYRFTVDLGPKPKLDKVTKRPLVDAGGNIVLMRDQRTHTFDHEKDAKRELGRILGQKADGKLVRTSKDTVANLCGTWLDGKRNLYPTTRRTYSDALGRFTERIGHIKACDLTKGHVDGVVDYLLTEGRRTGRRTSNGLSPRTVNLTLSVFSAVLDDAIKQGILGRNVVRMIDKPEGQQGEMKTWTDVQAGAFLASVAGDRLDAAWQLSSYGLRRGEVLGLRWSDIDLVKKTVTIRWTRTAIGARTVEKKPKTDRGNRVLPLDDFLVDALTALQLRQRDEREAAGDAYAAPCTNSDPKTGERCAGDHVVVNELGHPYRPEWYGERFTQLSKVAKLPLIRLHDVRHTCASVLHARGVPIADISKWLGHSKTSFTMDTYVKSQAGALAPALAILREAYAPQPA